MIKQYQLIQKHDKHAVRVVWFGIFRWYYDFTCHCVPWDWGINPESTRYWRDNLEEVTEVYDRVSAPVVILKRKSWPKVEVKIG